MLTIDVIQQRMVNQARRIVGIDLAGSEKRRTGWAFLHGSSVSTKVMKTADEILHATITDKPDLVSIDAPLSLPRGRCCTLDDCDCRSYGISRLCERELRKKGFGIYWTLIQSMQALTRRGMMIAQTLRHEGFAVIESFPGVAQDILCIPRKRENVAFLYKGLVRFGVKGLPSFKKITHDELDAVSSAIVGMFYLADLYEALGDAEEGQLIIPSLPA